MAPRSGRDGLGSGPHDTEAQPGRDDRRFELPPEHAGQGERLVAERLRRALVDVGGGRGGGRVLEHGERLERVLDVVGQEHGGGCRREPEHEVEHTDAAARDHRSERPAGDRHARPRPRRDPVVGGTRRARRHRTSPAMSPATICASGVSEPIHVAGVVVAAEADPHHARRVALVAGRHAVRPGRAAAASSPSRWAT